MVTTQQLKRARYAARKRGLEATLYINDWNKTCGDMDFRCAYCGDIAIHDGSVDHFIPLFLGGGTTIQNCVLSCRACNQAKADYRPEQFLRHQPKRLERLKYYLAHRYSLQPHIPFWTFPIPKEKLMLNKDEMQSTPQTLASGTELSLFNNEQYTVLQVRQPVSPDTDPLAIGFQVATILTAPECIQLAHSLLSYAMSKLEAKQLSEDLTTTSSRWG